MPKVLRDAAVWAALCGARLVAADSGLVVQPTVISEKYCLGQPGGLTVEHQPHDAVTLRLKVALTYRNMGTVPIILPVEHQLTAIVVNYTLGGSVIDPHQFVVRFKRNKPSGDFPKDLGDPPNGHYPVIPTGGESKLVEYVVLHVSGPSAGSKKEPVLLGQRIDLQLELSHLGLTTRLANRLRAKWQGIGTLWTGSALSNAIVVDVPMIPKISDCSHEYRID